MPSWMIDLIKIIFGGGLCSLLWEIYKKRKNKRVEDIEFSNLRREEFELNLSLKTNIDKYVDEKTASFVKQINELEKTIVQISTKYRSDLEKYLTRIADLEQKFDEQLRRTQHVEDQLSRETTDRNDCYELLRSVQTKLNQIEIKK